MLAATGVFRGVQRSTDGGATWTAVAAGDARQVLFDPNDPTHALAYVIRSNGTVLEHRVIFGAAGCWLRVSADLLRDGRATAAGTWNSGIAIAPLPGLLGRTFHVQLFVQDVAANSWGMTTSNALTLMMGN